MNAIFLLAFAATAAPDAPKGHLVVVGGGSTTGAITKKALELAGGATAKVLVVPQASGVANPGEGSVKMWRDLGPTSVEILNLADATAAVEQVKAANLIWIGGGDQNRLMKALAGTKIPDLMRERYHAGATVGGTSAGAAVMSSVMITGEADLTVISGQATKTAAGLGLWPGVIVDQHFVKRQRLIRLFGAVLDRPDLLGIGIDEATAAVVSGGKLEVVGKSQVIIVDARAAKVKAPVGMDSSVNDMRVHILTPGMTYDLKAPSK